MNGRFSRSAMLYGADSAEAFARARVAVCGVGAVGSFALEALARVGVGEFLLVDFDVVEESNINRQLCALSGTLGEKKTRVMRERVLEINPQVRVDIFDAYIDSGNVGEIVAWKPDVVVDAIDSADSKCALLIACADSGIAAVSSMGAARRKNPLAVRTGDIFDTFGCPLASRVRRGLRAAGVPRGAVMCAFSAEAPAEGSHMSCAGGGRKKIVGSTPVVTGTFGLVLADLAIGAILGKSGRG